MEYEAPTGKAADDSSVVASGEPLPATVARAEIALASDDSPGLAWPWRRYWARMLDVLIGACVVVFVLGVLRPSLFEPGGVFASKMGERVLTIVSLPFALIVDAIICRVCGNSAGKALAGIRTVHENGQVMSLFETVKRNLSLWFSGLGLGVPIVSLGTLVIAHGKAKVGRPCGWEISSGVRSVSQSDSVLRTTLVAAAFVGLGLLLRTLD